MSSASVLVLASDEAEAAAAGRALRLEAYAAHVARSASEALAVLSRGRRFGAVVADWSLPAARVVSDRLDALRSDAVRISQGAEAGAGAILLPRPATDAELRGAVREALARHALARQARSLGVLLRRRTRQIQALETRWRRDEELQLRALAAANVRLRECAPGAARLVRAALEHADPELAQRTDRVARLSVSLARRLGVAGAELEDVRLAAALRDVGLAGGGDDPSEEPGDDARGADREAWAGHPDRGSRLVEALPFSRAVVAGVRHHHERWDGRGFPDGLSGTQCPLVARVIAVADAYVDLTCGSATRRPLSAADAQAELIRGAGRRHDPEVVAALLRLMAEAERRAASAERDLPVGSPA